MTRTRPLAVTTLALGSLLLLSTAAPALASTGDAPRLVVYYQSTQYQGTTIYPTALATEDTGADILNLGALHLGDPATGYEVKLNDVDILDPSYDALFTDSIEPMQAEGMKVVGMLGGADNAAYVGLLDDFDGYYAALTTAITERGLDGIDLDIEETNDEGTELTSVAQQLITSLVSDFGDDFIISMSPVSWSLTGDRTGWYVDYPALYAAVGDDIDWFNVQFYSGGYQGESMYCVYRTIREYSTTVGDQTITWPGSKVNIGMITYGDADDGFVAPADLQAQIATVLQSYPDLGGMAGWEYIQSQPDPYLGAPWEWAEMIDSALTDPGAAPPAPTCSKDGEEPGPTPVPSPTAQPGGPGTPAAPSAGTAAPQLGRLAATGTDGAPAALGAAVVVLLGAAAVVVSRRRRVASRG